MMRAKDKKKPIIDDLSIFEDPLPPLDHDETDDCDAKELATYISEVVDGVEEEELDLRSDSDTPPLIDEVSIAKSMLIEASDESWVDDTESNLGAAIDTAFGDDAEGWLEGGDGEGEGAIEPLSDDWFIDDDALSLPDDGGDLEGPDNEASSDFEIGEASWDNLDDLASSNEDEEEPIAAMERLGIDLDTDDWDEMPMLDPPFVMDKQFLGPHRGGVAAAAFADGSPLAVGDGLYVLGADGMLYPVVCSESISGMAATSIYIQGESVFIGTATRGLLVTRDRGKTYKQLNSWFTQGLARGLCTSSEQVSTQFTVFGQVLPTGHRLLGCTGKGQLFCSSDKGLTWRSLPIPGPCEAAAPVVGTTELMLLTRSKTAGIQMWRSCNLTEWQPGALPSTVSAFRGVYPSISLAAVADTILLGTADIACPLVWSLDKGRSWQIDDTQTGVTAVALDPDDPVSMAVATHDPTIDQGVIRVSNTGGGNWQTVLRIDDAGARITGLSMRAGRTRELLAVTEHGVYIVTLASICVSH
ncbi:MAG: hypothetical protein QNJ97_10740 [Myxococcota bacterium]|nr:hypothetical protein [Myxococcota bacterium]